MIGPATYSTPEQNLALLDSWGSFAIELDGIYRWEWYGTFTFRDDRLGPEGCHKRWRRWTHLLNRRVFGVRYWKRGQGAAWLRGTESHRARNVRHYHALIGGGVGGESVFEWMERWDELAGFARIFPYEPAKGAAWYVTKYVAKDGEVDVWTPGQLALRQPRAAAPFDVASR